MIEEDELFNNIQSQKDFNNESNKRPSKRAETSDSARIESPAIQDQVRNNIPTISDRQEQVYEPSGVGSPVPFKSKVQEDFPLDAELDNLFDEIAVVEGLYPSSAKFEFRRPFI